MRICILESVGEVPDAVPVAGESTSPIADPEGDMHTGTS